MIGFGIKEKKQVRDVVDTIREFAKDNYDALSTNMKDYEANHKSQRDKYDKMDRSDAPERYFGFWTSMHDRQNVCDETSIELHFMHINRRHAMSPDGWASMTSEYILKVFRDGKYELYEMIRKG